MDVRNRFTLGNGTVHAQENTLSSPLPEYLRSHQLGFGRANRRRRIAQVFECLLRAWVGDHAHPAQMNPPRSLQPAVTDMNLRQRRQNRLCRMIAVGA